MTPYNPVLLKYKNIIQKTLTHSATADRLGSLSPQHMRWIKTFKMKIKIKKKNYNFYMYEYTAF